MCNYGCSQALNNFEFLNSIQKKNPDIIKTVSNAFHGKWLFATLTITPDIHHRTSKANKCMKYGIFGGIS